MRVFKPTLVVIAAATLSGAALAQGLDAPRGLAPPAAEAAPKPRPRVEDPRDRQKAMTVNDLFGFLITTQNPQQAAEVAGAIEQRWLEQGGDTVNLLLSRAGAVANEKRLDLASKLIDAAAELEPGYAEVWLRRAQVQLLSNQHLDAAVSLRRALDIEPRHFRAMAGLARLQIENGDKRGALELYRKLLRIYPLAPGAKVAIEELSRDLGDRGI